MTTIPNHTAILVFSRSATEEAAAKKYNKLFRHRGGARLASELIDHTVNQAVQTGLPVIRFFSDKQKGQSFGERFLHAVEESFRAGIEHLIVCGTDTPGLSSRHFLSVAEQLRINDLVLGPSADGGVYMIGLKKASFNRNLFAGISWLSPLVFSQLCLAAKQADLAYCTEAIEQDIDDGAAITELTPAIVNHWFSCLVRTLFSAIGKQLFFSFSHSIYSCIATGSAKHRGPPALAV